jgi:hypothetical protein
MSIDLNLFFLRIMKEHSLFLELGFMPKDKSMGEQAGAFRKGFERLLAEAVALANGNVSGSVLSSRQAATQYTMEAERLTNFYTGVPIDSGITRQELTLQPAGFAVADAGMEVAAENLDRMAYQFTSELAEFKERLLAGVRSCKIFTVNYPLLIDHILREAHFFMNMLVLLVRRESINSPQDLLNQEAFWNRIMAEHSKFIAGLLDPTEEALINTARMFGKEFDNLTAEAAEVTRQTMDIAKVTSDSRNAVGRLRDFKAAGTKGLVECKIQSIMVPLLGDHVLREANHYLCVLGVCRMAEQ